MNSTLHENKWNCNESTVLVRPLIITDFWGGGGGGGGLNRFYGAPTFTLIFRRGLQTLVSCSACMEVS